MGTAALAELWAGSTVTFLAGSARPLSRPRTRFLSVQSQSPDRRAPVLTLAARDAGLLGTACGAQGLQPSRDVLLCSVPG